MLGQIRGCFTAIKKCLFNKRSKETSIEQKIFKEIKIFLPKYLSEERQTQLFKDLSSFPENINKRFYTETLKREKNLFQGDGFHSLTMPDNEKKEFKEVKGLLISNSCDVDLENPRKYFIPYFLFSPIFSLDKYKSALLSNNKPQEKVDEFIEKIRSQEISNFFYLPQFGDKSEECFVRFDQIFNGSTEINLSELLIKRIFSLSNYGFYLFLFKLSIHFTRIRESIDRD